MCSTPPTRHFHCYLLHSLDPHHPHKTYIGFTTDPSRRLRQHNGDLKSGGARRTKRSGRPWQYVAIVHGFVDKKSALRWEWAWQHPQKSKYVRNAVGDVTATHLGRKRGIRAKLDILKTMLVECTDNDTSSLFVIPNRLGVYFFQNEWKDEFVRLQTESGRGLSSETIPCVVVNDVVEMPFWKERSSSRRRKTNKACTNEDVVPLSLASGSVNDDANDEEQQQQDVSSAYYCALCRRAIVNGKVTCTVCWKDFHEICLELEMEDAESDNDIDFATQLSSSWTCKNCIVGSMDDTVVDKKNVPVDTTRETQGRAGESHENYEEMTSDDSDVQVLDRDGGRRNIEHGLDAQSGSNGNPSLRYRSTAVDSSFESNDDTFFEDGGNDDGYDDDMLDWDYDNVHWDDQSRSSADTSPLIQQVTHGFLHQTLDDSPLRRRQGSSADNAIVLCDSPDVVTDSKISQGRSNADAIDLCETP